MVPRGKCPSAFKQVESRVNEHDVKARLKELDERLAARYA